MSKIWNILRTQKYVFLIKCAFLQGLALLFTCINAANKLSNEG